MGLAARDLAGILLIVLSVDACSSNDGTDMVVSAGDAIDASDVLSDEPFVDGDTGGSEDVVEAGYDGLDGSEAGDAATVTGMIQAPVQRYEYA